MHTTPPPPAGAPPYLRPRTLNLVNINGDGRRGDIGPLSSPRPSIAYRSADYDTNPGFAMTKTRGGMGDVDITKATGRTEDGLLRDVDEGQVYNEGETAAGGP